MNKIMMLITSGKKMNNVGYSDYGIDRYWLVTNREMYRDTKRDAIKITDLYYTVLDLK